MYLGEKQLDGIILDSRFQTGDIAFNEMQMFSPDAEIVNKFLSEQFQSMLGKQFIAWKAVVCKCYFN